MATQKNHEHHVEPGHEADAAMARSDTSEVAHRARKSQPLVAIAVAAAAVLAIALIALTRVNSGVGSDDPTVTASTMPATASGQELGAQAR